MFGVVISWLATLTRLFWPPDITLRMDVPIRVSACFLTETVDQSLDSATFSILQNRSDALVIRFVGRDMVNSPGE